MAFMIRRIFRYAAQKAASDPRVREKASLAAQFVSEEAKVIAREEDRARAAGRSVRRALNMLQGKPLPPRE
jgi:hypothetical protein